MIRALLMVLLLGLAGCGSGSDSSTTTTLSVPTSSRLNDRDPAVANPTTPAEPLTFAGDGQQNSEPFILLSGAYIATWEGTGSCFYGPSLNRSEGGLAGLHDLGSGKGPIKHTENIYGVQADGYFLHMITGPAPGCPWTLTLARR